MTRNKKDFKLFFRDRRIPVEDDLLYQCVKRWKYILPYALTYGAFLLMIIIAFLACR